MSFIAALDAELEALHNVLAADPTFVKWNELRKVRELYAADRPSRSVTLEPGSLAVGGGDAQMTVNRGRRADPDKSRAITEAEAIITAANGEPVPTSQIWDVLTERGIEIQGERPVNNLSAMLSNSKLFTANGRRGWTLRKEGDEDQSRAPEEVFSETRYPKLVDPKNPPPLPPNYPPPPPPVDLDMIEGSPVSDSPA